MSVGEWCAMATCMNSLTKVIEARTRIEGMCGPQCQGEQQSWGRACAVQRDWAYGSVWGPAQSA